MSAESTVATPATERYTRGERVNMAPSGKRFMSYFIEPGLVSYRDNKNGKVELLRKETIEEALNSMLDAPLTIKHPVRPWNREDVAKGRVDKTGYDAQCAWFFCEGDVSSDDARQAIRNNAKPSCGYDVLELGPGGTWHNIPYDQEITKIRFHHLALVENPRYETADIRLNSKNNMIPKWIQKIISKVKGADGVETEKIEERVNELPLETVIDIGEGQTATLQQLIESSRTNAKASAPSELSRNDDIEVEGVRYNVGALIETHRKNEAEAKAKDCEDDDAKKKAEEKEKEDRCNALKQQEEKEKQAKAEHDRLNEIEKNRASFRILGKARQSPHAQIQSERQNSSESDSVKLKRGIERYGRRPAIPGAN